MGLLLEMLAHGPEASKSGQLMYLPEVAPISLETVLFVSFRESKKITPGWLGALSSA